MEKRAKPPAGRRPALLRPGGQVEAGSRRNTRYELFVLGELMGAPMHGYLLREILNRVLGPFRQISWGVLYPLIHDLERKGLIAVQPEPGSEGSEDGASSRQPRTYHITDAGQERFHGIMREPAAYTADYPELFMLKLNLFGNIAPAERRSIVQHHRAYLQTAAGYLRREQEYVTHRLSLPERERPHILRFLGYRLTKVQAELAWVDGELARLGQDGQGAPDAHSV